MGGFVCNHLDSFWISMGQECRGSSFNGTINSNSFFFFFLNGGGDVGSLYCCQLVNTFTPLLHLNAVSVIAHYWEKNRGRHQHTCEWCLGETRPIHKEGALQITHSFCSCYARQLGSYFTLNSILFISVKALNVMETASVVWQ